MSVEVINIDGQKTGEKIKLPTDIFGVEPNDHAIYLSVKLFLANQRQGTHKAKERGEVEGSTRKIKKQKGTGTARAGSIKNPLFRGGGRVFGPKPRNYGFKLNKKLKDVAKKSALSYKALENNILVAEDFTFSDHKTKNMEQALHVMGLDTQKALFIVQEYDPNLMLAARNIKKVDIKVAKNMSTYELLNADKLVITKSALNSISELFDEKNAK
jgi:large subunit ribosomal protein L4